MVRFITRRLGRKVTVVLVPMALVLAFGGIWLSGDTLKPREVWVIAAAVGGALLGTLLALRVMVLQRLAELARVMSSAEPGSFLVRAKVDSEDEIGQLAQDLNVMLAKITDMNATQIDSEREKEWLERELSLNTALAEKSAELERRVKELMLLTDVSGAISSSLELSGVLSRVTEMAGITLGFDEFSVLLYEPSTREYVITQTYGFDEEAGRVEGLSFRDDEGVISIAHESGKTVLIGDTRKEPRYLHYKGRREGDGSLLVIPMRYRGEPVGALAFNRPGIDAFDASEVRVLETMAGQAALAIANARLYQQTLELALTDALTGVFNRRQLERRLEMEINRAERFEHAVSVLMIDIDHFKVYNDTHGHPQGDEVLCEVAGVLRDAVRSVDTVARYGGEEFTVVLPRIGKERGRDVAEKLRRAVEARDFAGGESQPLGRVTLSVGIAAFPEDADSAGGVLRNADIALYHAKAEGRNRTVTFYDGMEALGGESGAQRALS